MNLSALLQEDYLPRRRSVSSDSTRSHYLYTLKQLDEMLGRPATLDDLTEEVAERFLVWLRDVRHQSPPTIKQRRSYLLAFWSYYAKKGMTKEWPTIEPVKCPQHVPDAWTVEQYTKLLKHCQTLPGVIAGIPARLWWWSLHLFVFYEGERVGACLSARWENYTDDGTLIIPATDRKGRQKYGTYHLHPAVQKALEKIREPARELIWPWDRSRSRFYQHYKSIVLGAGLPRKKRTGLQKARRTHASYLAKMGGNATESLMHSSPSVTTTYYLDPRIVKPAQPQNRKLPRVG